MTSPRSPRPVRRWIFVIASVLWILVSVGILAVMVSPSMPLVEMAAISAVAYAFNPFLLILVLVGVAIVLVGVRHRRRVIALLAGITAALLATAVVVPTAVLSQAAADRDIPLSVPALVGSPSGGLAEPTETTTYTGDLQLDVWQAENQADAANSALIYVYGGGFSSGTRDQWAPFFQHLTSQGISVFAMDYTLSTADEPSYESAASDVACAVGWVRENAHTYDIDTERLVLAGGSAGANLALLTAYSAQSDAITPSCEVGDTSVRAVIDFYGPVDLAETAGTTGSPAVADSLEQYLGATPEQEPARYELLSPATYIDGDVPPTLILHGDRDSGVPLAQSTGLAESLDDAGVPNELVVVPAAEHGFDAAWGSFANQIAQAEVTRFFEKYVTN